MFLSLGILCVDFLTSGALRQILAAPASFSPLSVTSWVGSVTYVFGHADAAHWMGNMSFVLILGAILEEKYGSFALAVMMLVTAIATAVVNATLFDTGLIGASGIVFMMITLASVTGIRERVIPLSLILVFGINVGGEVLSALRSDSVSQFAHIFGGIAGALLGIFFPKKT